MVLINLSLKLGKTLKPNTESRDLIQNSKRFDMIDPFISCLDYRLLKH